MAYLLGSKTCIESLQNDVKDLHTAVVDVFSRVGPVRYPSWKYPDKMSCDIDIGELLAEHQYSDDDDEESQVAHIVLLELVIERMVLLFQSMAKFIEQSLSVGRATSALTVGSNMSIGLIIKKFWNKMVQMNSMVNQMQSQAKTHQRKLSDLETTVEKLNQPRDPEMPPVKPLPGIDFKRSSPVLPDISKDCSYKSCQTIETAFVPCDACDRVQHHLKQIGDTTIHTCKAFNLPSSLAKYKVQIESVDWMSANDIGRWVGEQNKDMTRINKHFEQIMNTVEPLKADLFRAGNRIESLEADVADSGNKIKEEKEMHLIQMKQYEMKVSTTEKKSQEAVNQVKRKNEELNSSKKVLEKQVVELKGELDKQITALKHLETAQVEFIKDLQERAKSKEHVDRIEAEKALLSEELESVKEQMDLSAKELSKEQARNKSIHKHTESLQAKQDSLLQRLEELDQENQELRDQTAELEDKCESLEEKLESLTPDNEKLIQQVKKDKVMIQELSECKKALEDSIMVLQEDIKTMENQMSQLQEREKLLLEYPDLNGPINAGNGTGDIARDMENQVQANSLRIQLLENENEGLRNSITKMLASQAQRKNETNSQLEFQSSLIKSLNSGSAPLPLWKKNSLERIHQETQDKVEEDDPSVYDQDKTVKAIWTSSYRLKKLPSPSNDGKSLNQEYSLIGKRPPSGKQIQQKQTGSKANQTSNSSIAAYLQLKKSGKLKSDSKGSLRGASGVQSLINAHGDITQDMFVCTRCDKMYTSRRDLDIHKSYCAG
ncbi:coiled-coil domain-containing protein 157-like [Tubulanus polymorphus]|uniref:coiled-coil domain-containing protein 157-like n=1 Tax=Tubulanus polymorphus TaxID=672921 RepID=UPI003DA3EFC7